MICKVLESEAKGEILTVYHHSSLRVCCPLMNENPLPENYKSTEVQNTRGFPIDTQFPNMESIVAEFVF